METLTKVQVPLNKEGAGRKPLMGTVELNGNFCDLFFYPTKDGSLLLTVIEEWTKSKYKGEMFLKLKGNEPVSIRLTLATKSKNGQLKGVANLDVAGRELQERVVLTKTIEEGI